MKFTAILALFAATQALKLKTQQHHALSTLLQTPKDGPPPCETIDEKFKEIDADGNGEVDSAEAKAEFGAELTEEEWDVMWQKGVAAMDTDDDKTISLDEVKKILGCKKE